MAIIFVVFVIICQIRLFCFPSLLIIFAFVIISDFLLS